MAHSISAQKRVRQNNRRQSRNRAARAEARTAVRRAREAIAAKDANAAKAKVQEAFATLDRAARKGVLHPNNASRRKSRLALLLAKSLKGGS